MAVVNPFATFDPEGGIWEQGFQAGFNVPDFDHSPPLAPTLLDAYLEGQQTGRAFKRAGPAGSSWENFEELGSSVLLHAILDHVAAAFGGMLALVIEVVQIPGDTVLKPLPENFTALANQNDARSLTVCLRTDHVEGTPGATSEGTWAGSSRDDFTDAASDMRAHGHDEAFVARCSVREQTCGAVWAIR